MTIKFQTDDCLEQSHEQASLHHGPGPGHHVVARHHLRPAGRDGVSGPAPVQPVLSQARLGGARRQGNLGLAGGGADGGAGQVAAGCGRYPGHRRDQPARDDAGVGPRHRRAAVQRHRLAGPAHLPVLRRDPRRMAGEDPGQDRPGAGCLLLGHQGEVDPGQRGRCPGTRRARRAVLRHGGHLAHLELHARQGARHRPQQRQPHDALQHPHAGLGRRTSEALRCAARHAAGGEELQRGLWRDLQPLHRVQDPHRRHRR